MSVMLVAELDCQATVCTMRKIMMMNEIQRQRGWAVVEMMDGKMCCYPQGDIREHDIEAPCWCAPFYVGDVLVHQSADRREEIEPDSVFPRNT